MDYDKVTVLKNYEAQAIVSGSERINNTLKQIQGGTLTLIDNDNDDEVEYVIYNEYTAGVVTNYSTSGDGSIKVTGIDKYDDAADVVGFDDVAKGDFVLAIEYGGKLYVELPETITGELQSFSVSKATVKVDDTTYDISDIVPSVTGADKETYAIYSYLEEDNILGTTATYYLDNNGYVVAVCDADETYGNYAVILAKQSYSAGSANDLGEDARVKVLLADGTIATYDIYSINGKKPGSDGYSEAKIDQYDVYSYAMTDDGDIKLGTERGTVTNTTSGMSYTKGSSSLSLSGNKYTVTGSTVFLYYDGSEVTRFEGRTSPDIGTFDASTAVTVATSSNKPNEAAVVFVNDTATAQYDGNYLYIYKDKVSKNSDGYEADAILADGTIATIVIDSDSFDNFDVAGESMKIKVGMYAYSVSDDVYSLSQSSNGYTEYVMGGTITASRSDYITVGNSYTLTSDTIVAYGEKNKTASVGEALNTGDKVAFVINEDGEVEFAVITAYAADEYAVTVGGAEADASNKLTYVVNGETETLADGNLAVGTELTVVAEPANMVVVNVNGEKTYLANGAKYTLTAADTTFSIVAKPTVAVTSGATTVYGEVDCSTSITYVMPNTTVYTKATSNNGYLTGEGLTLEVAASSTSGAVYSFKVGTENVSIECTADSGYTITMAGSYSSAAGTVTLVNGNDVEIEIPADGETFVVPTDAQISIDLTSGSITSVAATDGDPSSIEAANGVYTLTEATTITLAD